MWQQVPRDEAERRRGFEPAGATPEEWARKPSLFIGGPGRQLMTAQSRVHALDLPEQTSFTAKHAR
jgi:hypothetical protein